MPYTDYQSKTNQKWIKSSHVFRFALLLLLLLLLLLSCFTTPVNSSLCAFLHILIFFLLLFVLYLPVSTITVIIMAVWISVDRIDFLHLKSNNAGGSCVHKCVHCMSHLCRRIYFFSSSSSSSSVVSLVHFYSVPFCFVPFIRSFNSSHLIGWNVILQCIFFRTIVIDLRLKMRRQKCGKWRATTTTKNKWEQRASSFLPWIGT